VDLDQALPQVVLPGPRQLRDVGLEGLDVDLGLADVGGEEEVEPHLLLVLPHGQLVIDVAGAQHAGEVRLDPAPHVGVEPVTRHHHHHREPPCQRVRADGEAHPALLLEAHDGPDLLEELRRLGPEQVRAGHGVEDLDDLLVVVRAAQAAVELDHLAELPPQHGDLVGGGEVGLAGEQADEAKLALHVPAVAQLLDPDVVHARGLVDGCLGVGLGDDHHAAAEHPLTQFVGELGDRDRLAVGALRHLAEHPEAGTGGHLQGAAVIATVQVVLPEPQVDEVVVVEPLQEAGVLLELLAAPAVRTLGAALAETPQVGRDLGGPRAHGGVVVGGQDDVAQDPGEGAS
jgi:hypothetical protein